LYGLLLAAMTVMLSIGLMASTPDDGAVPRFMSTTFSVTPSEFARLNAGKVVSRTLPAKDSREIATLGVVRMKITPEFYVEQFANIAKFKQDEAILQIGVFSNPPDLRDVANLTLDDSDLRSLKDCRVGDCGVQLPADAIERFRQQVDWQQPDAQQRANALIRQMLVTYVTEYERLGRAASMRYADTSTVVDMPREFASLAEANAAMWQQLPALPRHLLEYPEGPATGAARDLVYWSKEKMGRRPVVSVTHVAIVRTGAESPAEYAVASKHLYGTHYLDASLGLTILLRDGSSSSPSTYVAYLNRSRVDVFRGIFGGMIRRIVTSRARGTVADQLERVQRKLESQFLAQQQTS